ncbi:SphA family protein [Pseudomonas syringae]|uniref:SphA family protein n=1 Tax=Pseudomonas syringae TaxID=317 RepID=UPI000AA30198|nr:transporter [Pseudomonas syringae]
MNNKKVRKPVSFIARSSLSLTGAALAAFLPSVHATEGGGSSYPMGAENYLTGAMPPPGFYGQVFAESYRANRLLDNRGSKALDDFHLSADVIAPRLIWVTGQKVFDGDLAFHLNIPLVDLKVDVNGQHQRKTGMGDIIFGPALGYHYSQNFHAIYAIDIFAPTGEYDRGDLANIGRNYWAIEPIAAFSYVDPAGLNADLKMMYDFNQRNRATDYRSGQEAHADYSLGWGLGNGWVVGVGGYVYRQITDDRQDGDTVRDTRGRAFAIGPSIKYASASGWFVTAKWQKESDVRNRPEGEAYWVKLTLPL